MALLPGADAAEQRRSWEPGIHFLGVPCDRQGCGEVIHIAEAG